MSDIEALTDSVELRDLRAAGSAVVVPEPPPLDVIRTRGRARRRQRHYGVAAISGVGVVGAGLAVGVAGAPHSAPGTAPGTIRTAAYTLVSHTDGTATLTITPTELFDPATLQDDLARDGIPAKVTVGSFCTSDPTPSGFAQVVSFDPGTSGGQGEPGGPATITIDPSAMPAGAELSIGEVPLERGMDVGAVTLVDTAAFTCDSSPTQFSSSDGELPFGRGNGLAFIMVPDRPNGS